MNSLWSLGDGKVAREPPPFNPLEPVCSRVPGNKPAFQHGPVAMELTIGTDSVEPPSGTSDVAYQMPSLVVKTQLRF